MKTHFHRLKTTFTLSAGAALLLAVLAGAGANETDPKHDQPTAAPYGRMLHCVLTNTLESANPESPVIGLAAADLLWDGHCLIPAGSEIHGVTNGRVRDRIECGNRWVIVLKDPSCPGRVLNVQAAALNEEVTSQAAVGRWPTYTAMDGVMGLRGIPVDHDCVRVISGKTFYLYVEQPLDLEKEDQPHV